MHRQAGRQALVQALRQAHGTPRPAGGAMSNEAAKKLAARRLQRLEALAGAHTVLADVQQLHASFLGEPASCLPARRRFPGRRMRQLAWSAQAAALRTWGVRQLTAWATPG